jgi:hypothetical protein
MKILIDIHLILDVLLDREPHVRQAPCSGQLEKGGSRGMLAAHEKFPERARFECRLRFSCFLFSHIAGVEELTSTTPYTIVADGSRNSGALYAQIEHQLRDDLRLIGGFQTNKIGNISVNTVPVSLM